MEALPSPIFKLQNGHTNNLCLTDRSERIWPA
jgi:hypothetical protein